jgi:DNA-directed RNA polymerase specialized sigma24 family protein
MMWGRGRKIQHSDGDDLYNEAIMRALDDPEWSSAEPKAMFYRLLGHIYNITRNWTLERRRYFDSEMPEIPVPPNDIDDEDDEASAIRAMKRRLRTHVVASAVLDTILNNEKPAEALETLGISMKSYAAARRRIFRLAQKLYPLEERPKS